MCIVLREESKTSKKEQALEWAKQFETTRRWLSEVQASKTGSEKTQSEYAYRLKAFCEWAKKTPDQLIAERKTQLKSEDDTENRKAEELVTGFFNFQAKSNRMSAKSYHGAIRSFYKYNYTLLRSVTPKARAKTIFPITMEEFKQIDEMVIPRDRALLRFMKDSGLSTEDVVVFNYGDIRKEFEEGKDFIHLRAVRQKMEINYDTFIGPNAVEALRFYFQIRKQKGEVFSDGTPLFPSGVSNKDGKYERLTVSAVRTVFDRIKRKTGITVSPHRIRKLFSSRLSAKVRHPVVLKHWMGHGTGGDVEGSYVLPPLNEQLEIYKDAYSEIDIKPKIMISREELTRTLIDELPEEMLETAAKKHGLTVAQYRTALRERKLDLKKEDQKNATDGGCINGHCQKIVSEEELPQLLANGWTFVATLPSGKCVVSNET